GRRRRRQGGRRSPLMKTWRNGPVMRKRRGEPSRLLRPHLVGIALVLLVSAGWISPASGAITQQRFASLDEAAQALVNAVRAGDRKAMLAILGEDGKGLVSSGDEVADRNAGARFVAEYDAKHQFEGGGGKVVLVVGRDDFPFPIPLVPDGPSWRFDTAAGTQGV